MEQHGLQISKIMKSQQPQNAERVALSDNDLITPTHLGAIMGFLKIENTYKMKKAKLYTWLIKFDLGAIGKNSIMLPPF